jgi:hypothetical protein
MLLLKALLTLLKVEFYLQRGDFKRLYQRLRACPVASVPPRANTLERVCSAFDLACLCFPKRALCLQRSAALACLLRANGIDARMIIGAQLLPFRAHAWVEVEGKVVNDRPYVRQIYGVLETC